MLSKYSNGRTLSFYYLFAVVCFVYLSFCWGAGGLLFLLFCFLLDCLLLMMVSCVGFCLLYFIFDFQGIN